MRRLSEAGVHANKQQRSLSRALEREQTPSFLKSSVRPPHPHRGFHYRPSFLKAWEAANNKVGQLFLKLTKEEYEFQVEDIQNKLVEAKEAGGANIKAKFTDPRELQTATGLFNSLSTSRKKGVKRKREET